MCGILAFASDNVKNFNGDKFNILGILNETRGKHSCGVAIDGKIHKGVDTFKVWRDFAAFMPLSLPDKHPIVIGHTRHATGGAHNIFNAHPFGFKDNIGDKHNSFIGVHNGSLYNHKEIALEFGIDKTASYEKIKGEGKHAKRMVSYREKIDSEILLETIHKTGKYDVLEQYNGAAALVWYKMNEPNVMYCYHGMSKVSEISKDPVEERPLFYAEIDGGTYISSLAESLMVIGAEVNDVQAFEHNIVYKITNGNVEQAEKTTIDRSNSFKGKISRSKQSASTHKKDQIYYNTCEFGGGNGEQLKLPISKTNSRVSTNDITQNIYNEETVKNVNDYKSILYFNKLRYWRNGHLATGIYAYIRGFGHYYMGHTVSGARTSYKNYINKVFTPEAGEFSLTIKPTNNDNVPFNHANIEDIKNYPFEYIFQGVSLKTELDYEQLMNISKNAIHSTEALSYASKHPIINTNVFRGSGAQNIVYNGKEYSGRFTVLGAEKLYSIQNGNLIKCSLTNKNFNVMSGKDLTDTKALQKELVNIVVNDMKSEVNVTQVTDTTASDDMLLSDINKMVLNFYTSLPEIIVHARSFNASEIKSIILDNLTSIECELDDIALLESKLAK